MKKTVSTLCLLLLSLTMFGQTFTSLWNQVKDAAEKDLPQTQQKVLGQIVKKAERKGLYSALEVGCIWLERELKQANS